MKKILMVCLGNICRSPLAEGLLRDKIKSQKINALVDSAGTSNYHIGEAPDPRSAEIARKYGIDISDLKGRQFGIEDFDQFDHIFVMDENNYADVLMLCRNQKDKDKIKLILNLTHPGQNKPVPDPYYGGAEGFENMYRLLDAATDKIIEELSNN